MRIVQLVSGKGVNGAISHCRELTRELAERGHAVLLLHKPGAWIGQQVFPAGVETAETTLKRKPAELRRVAAVMRAWQADVIHTHLSSAHFFGVLVSRWFGFRCVATSHMTLLQPHWWWNDRVIAPSQATAKFQRRVNWVPGRRVDVVHNFINPDRFQPQRSAEAVRQELGIDSQAFVITVVGQVTARKAQHNLVRALPAIRQAGIRPHVLLVGKLDPEYSQQMQQQIDACAAAGQVSLLGQREDVADLLNATDCCCLPSNREVMPISLLEAMSMGLPAVGTRVGGVPESIRDGVDGFLVPPDDPPQLAAALIKLGRDAGLRAAMGRAAGESMRAKFSPDVCVAGVLESYARASGSERGVA